MGFGVWGLVFGGWGVGFTSSPGDVMKRTRGIEELRMDAVRRRASICSDATCSGVWGLGCGVRGLEFGVWGLEIGVWGVEFGVWVFEVWGSVFRFLGKTRRGQRGTPRRL